MDEDERRRELAKLDAVQEPRRRPVPLDWREPPWSVDLEDDPAPAGPGGGGEGLTDEASYSLRMAPNGSRFPPYKGNRNRGTRRAQPGERARPAQRGGRGRAHSAPTLTPLPVCDGGNPGVPWPGTFSGSSPPRCHTSPPGRGQVRPRSIVGRRGEPLAGVEQEHEPFCVDTESALGRRDRRLRGRSAHRARAAFWASDATETAPYARNPRLLIKGPGALPLHRRPAGPFAGRGAYTCWKSTR